MTRLRTNALMTISAAMLISVLAAVTGCSDRKPKLGHHRTNPIDWKM